MLNIEPFVKEAAMELKKISMRSASEVQI